MSWPARQREARCSCSSSQPGRSSSCSRPCGAPRGGGERCPMRLRGHDEVITLATAGFYFPRIALFWSLDLHEHRGILGCRRFRQPWGEIMDMSRRLGAEFFGTFWLVLGGCGSAVLAAAFPQLGIGFAGVALAFGLTVLTMAYAIGHVSGCHLNPAVSVGLWAGGRFKAAELLPYIVAQVLGAIAGAAVLYAIASGKAGFDVHAGFASNGFGEHSPGGYALAACLVCEVVMTFGFVFVIMGSTHGSAPRGFAPIAIGLGLTLIHLISIPVTNTSVNPARSTGPALFAGGWAIQQLWLFWLAPLIGAAFAGVVYRVVGGEEPAPVEVAGDAPKVKA